MTDRGTRVGSFRLFCSQYRNNLRILCWTIKSEIGRFSQTPNSRQGNPQFRCLNNSPLLLLDIHPHTHTHPPTGYEIDQFACSWKHGSRKSHKLASFQCFGSCKNICQHRRCTWTEQNRSATWSSRKKVSRINYGIKWLSPATKKTKMKSSWKDKGCTWAFVLLRANAMGVLIKK